MLDKDSFNEIIEKFTAEIDNEEFTPIYNYLLKENYKYTPEDIGQFSGILYSNKIDMLKNMKRVPAFCFYKCRGVSGDLVLGSNIKKIGVEAFGGCNFSKIVIPTSVTSIGHDAFTKCNAKLIYEGGETEWSSVSCPDKEFLDITFSN